MLHSTASTRRVLFLLSILSVLGFGCNPQTPSSPSPSASGPKPVDLSGLSPHDAAQKIVVTSSSVIELRSKFTGSGIGIAHELGWGNEADYEIVIRRFAPGNRADIEWKRSTNFKKSDGQDEKRQYVGTILGAALRQSHDMVLPSLWVEGERDALGTGILWLSQDVYENLSRTHESTWTFGILNKELFGVVTSSAAFTRVIHQLTQESSKPIYKDPTLTSADSPTVQKLKINGQEVEVEVVTAHNWLGEFTFLNNPQNPIILRASIKTIPGARNDGFFDYTVTELKDIQE